MTLQQLAQDAVDERTESAVGTSIDWVEDMATMHRKFGVNPVIRQLDRTNLRLFLKFRIDFLQEELDELRKEYDLSLAVDVDELNDADRAEALKDAADNTVDALIDLCVVAIGTLNAFDVDSHVAWQRVLDANMSKNPGVNPTRPNPLGLPDLIKPAGWKAPTHADNVGLFQKVFE